MRVAATTLLVFGFLLCVSIAWAAIGFVAMGFGLICLLIVEERNKTTAFRSGISEIEPKPTGSPRPIAASISTANIREDLTPREMDKWCSLVASDEDLSQVVTILALFGQKYVNQLARTYIVFDDKAYLPTILKQIVASAREDAELTDNLEADNSNVIPIGPSAANRL
jgi:hypothetical protein